MGKIYGICDFRRGKIGDLVFRKVADKNIVSEKANYYPVNSAWLKKEEFKKYVLSLLDEGIPQVYVLNELPEEIYPYALIFIQNQGGTSIYVDKEGIRTHINIGGNVNDTVNVVENLPQDLQNNVTYYSENKINEQKILEKGLKLDEQKSYVYVYENDEIKQVIPNVDYITEEQMVFKNKTINGEDNTVQNLIPEKCIKPGYILNKIEESKQYYGFVNFKDPNDIIFTDNNTLMALVYVYRAKVKDGMITEIISKSKDQVYYYGAYITYEGKDYMMDLELDQVYPILDKSIVYTQTIKTYVDDKTQPINDLTTKCLKDVYNQTLPANKNVITDNNGFLTTSDGPHLYIHHYHYGRSSRGDISFFIYTSSSTELNNTQLGDYLYNLKCTAYWTTYPACGEGQYANAIIDGVYVTLNSGGLIKYTFHVTSHNASNHYDELIANYLDNYSCTISQIF